MAVSHQSIAERMARAFNTSEFSVFVELFTPDCVIEWPQSGEVVHGRDNWQRIMENYPDRPPVPVDLDTLTVQSSSEYRLVKPMFKVIAVQDRGDAATITLRNHYPDGKVWWSVIIYRLRGDMISHCTTFFAQEFEAPEWRAPYVEKVPHEHSSS